MTNLATCPTGPVKNDPNVTDKKVSREPTIRLGESL